MNSSKFLSAIIFFFLSATYSYSQTISFTASNLAGENVNNPTSLQFGPDGRLYVAQQDGKIFAYTVVRNAPNNYAVTATEVITQIQQIPNHNDDGTPVSNVNTRQVTGILVTGTAQNPVLYVSSSDPRIGGGPMGLGNNKNLDTNSGMISKLVRNGSSWTRIDLVRGLPRSEENHATNGMQLDEVNNILYVTQGGNTNMGAPSNNFVFLPEYALATTILTVDLNVIGNNTYDLPTLDDEDRPNVSNVPGYTDANDPFGGNNGKNQAIIDLNGPVQIYSTGWRNHYDLVITKSGKMYSFDNGPNTGWGGFSPNCLNEVVEPGAFYCDVLHYVPGPGYYAGHPNPTRGNRANTFNASNPQSPVPPGLENPVECNYVTAGNETHALTTICSSTNGMCEYTASNFSNALKGDLLAAAFNGNLYRFKLNASGTAIVPGGQTVFANSFGSVPLDVIAQGDADIFPGTVWAVTYVSNDIVVFEPADYAEATPELLAYNDADKIRGGRLYDTFWATETGFTEPNDLNIDMTHVTSFPEFYRCKSCHAYDLKGRAASFIDYPALVDRPRVTGVNLYTRVPQMTIKELFDKVKHDGAAAVDPARTADGTNNTLGGHRMPDYGKLLTDSQIWDIVKFLKEGALDTEELYDITTTGNYPTGTKTFSNIGKNGDYNAGISLYHAKCKNCHGANGREGSLPNGLGGFINDNIGMSIGEYARKKPYELQHKAVHGELGTNMKGMTDANIDDIKNLLKALSDKVAFPDMQPVWYRDADGDGYGVPGDTSMALFMPTGYAPNDLDCDDNNPLVYPGAVELCDGLDNNCNGEIDEGTCMWTKHINAGGTKYISTRADTFINDFYYTSGCFTFSNHNANIGNTNDPEIYSTERFGNFSYNIPVPELGLYEVRLHFAEIWSGGQDVGKRIFHVDMEGARKLNNYDIFSRGGGYKAVTETFFIAVTDGMLNIKFTPVVNNAKVSAISVIWSKELEQLYVEADPLNGGRLYDRFWANETDFVIPADASLNMNDMISFPDFYRCKSCHGWDQKGNIGAYIDRPATTTRPAVAGEIVSYVRNNSAFDIYSKIKNTGGAAVNPSRTADGTNASLGGNAHPDYGKILNDKQIFDIVKYLKEKAFDTEALYDLSTTGVYPTATKAFSNIGKNGDALAGIIFYSNNCAACHGDNGRDDAYFHGLSIGELARTKPYEFQHKAVFGNLGTSMYGVNDATIEEIKNLLKALSDAEAYPDLYLVFYADKDGDGYGDPNDSIISPDSPTGYVRNNLDCDDTNPDVYPGAPEVLDGLDNNCNGLEDEGLFVPGSVFINTGGTQYISVKGDTFINDWHYASIVQYPTYTFMNNNISNISNTDDADLYLSERNGDIVSYNIPVENGSYTVRLHFAEIYFGLPGGGSTGGVGSRVFHALIEGDTILHHYDIFSDAGGAAVAVVKEFNSITVVDQKLEILLSGVINRAKISAISIIPDSTSEFNDCNQNLNGTAYLDDCGVCVEGNTGLSANTNKDCEGNCFGNAYFDDCGVCVEGNTGLSANANKDCHGDCFGTAYPDDCGECVEGNTGLIANTDKDCNGDCFGTATIDDCGICAGGNTGLLPDADKDGCGVCFGNSVFCCVSDADCDDGNPCTDDYCIGSECQYFITNDSGATYLKVTNPAKSWRKLKLGYTSNSLWGQYLNVAAMGHQQMCITMRAPQGSLEWNRLQIRPQASTNKFVTISNYIPQNTGNDWFTICIPLSDFSPFNFTSISFIEIPYSNGAEAFKLHLKKIEFTGGAEPLLWFGDNKMDNFHDGTGSGGSLIAELVEGEEPCDPGPVVDCSGLPGGTAFVNDCGICVGGDTGLNAHEGKDCHGDCGGSALLDDCGVCVEGNTGLIANANIDCEGVCFGTAFIDNCGVCVGGTTDVEPNSSMDCHGDCYGTAYFDNCGVCVGGNTGLIANGDKDCAGVCFGSATIDNCGVCGGINSTCGSCEPRDVVALMLMYPGTAGEIGLLTDGMVINKSQTGKFNIRADVCVESAVKSVQFILNGSVFRTENVAPYALNGDKDGSYYAWDPPVGNYTLTVTAYSGGSASGTAGALITVNFEVTAYTYKKDENVIHYPAEPDIQVYPNPNSGFFNIELNLPERADVILEIYTQLGQSVYRHHERDYLGEMRHNVNMENQPSGIYILRLHIGDEWYQRKVAVR